MRGLFTASLVAAGLAGRVFAHTSASHNDDGPVRRRKSLGFGPIHPHAVFRANPPQVHAEGLAPRADADPFDVARRFAEVESQGQSYYVRPDSYTDKNTGVTHVYIRQLVNGMEVADGDMNINVKDGVVLSHSNSFYTGSAPGVLDTTPEAATVHAEFCAKLGDELVNHHATFAASSSGQVVMGSQADKEKLEPIQHVYDSNCAHVDLPSQFATGSDAATFDPYKPLLQFMIAAAPTRAASADILSKYDEYLSKMEATFEHHLVGGAEQPLGHIANVPSTVSPVKARFMYVQVPSGGKTALHPVWKFEVEMEDNWYEAAVSVSEPHHIISVVDWASDSPIPSPKPPADKKGATYNVFAWGINDPSEGNRTIEKENFDAHASPAGWHALPYANDPQSESLRKKKTEFWRNTTTTWGNNVFAHEDWEGRNAWVDNYRPDAGESLEFDYKYAPKDTDSSEALEEAQKYINATVTQLFYTSNLVHDLYYRYGFDEVSGNFQQYNFGRGGKENDAVIANAQDGSGYNNANFMTPPDGQNGRCRMYLWNTASPYRDGDLEAGIVIHELSHGLSTRLTGGPANSGCLGWGESGGMGEGWGDFLATTIRSTSNYSDYAMGAWAANRETGIRNYKYSLNETINPSTYKTLDKPGYWGVHAIGEVWAQILWVVSQRLIEKHGYSDSLFPPTPLANGTVPEGDFYRPQEFTAAGVPKPLVPKHGNSLSVQLVLNGMKLQPCRPSFFDARDAIIQADEILTGGENKCELWLGFSSRGLGPNARVDGRTPWGGGIRTDDYAVPSACKPETVPEEPKAPEDDDGDEFIYM
ncbi:hypothetical protein PLICRDRAFT_45604 [Plicaturopsis crispa FD-325 SS-3]|uniref:Extracellular metalloproteinase n=1 Tax=Plicaturopsis crispa FD-325 SS-3 TaxID=944288 RepID=A0A0C9SRM0_PLICR|nr:hypothetical protein PLICRDRAFT_45604 [Plicaturopsis crispa FD-325 SS-3]